MRPRFEEPQPHEEPKVLDYCQVCGVDLVHGDDAYKIDQEIYCADCGLDYLRTDHSYRMNKEDYR